MSVGTKWDKEGKTPPDPRLDSSDAVAPPSLGATDQQLCMVRSLTSN